MYSTHLCHCPFDQKRDNKKNALFSTPLPKLSSFWLTWSWSTCISRLRGGLILGSWFASFAIFSHGKKIEREPKPPLFHHVLDLSSFQWKGHSIGHPSDLIDLVHARYCDVTICFCCFGTVDFYYRWTLKFNKGVHLCILEGSLQDLALTMLTILFLHCKDSYHSWNWQHYRYRRERHHKLQTRRVWIWLVSVSNVSISAILVQLWYQLPLMALVRVRSLDPLSMFQIIEAKRRGLGLIWMDQNTVVYCPSIEFWFDTLCFDETAGKYLMISHWYFLFGKIKMSKYAFCFSETTFFPLLFIYRYDDFYKYRYK